MCSPSPVPWHSTLGKSPLATATCEGLSTPGTLHAPGPTGVSRKSPHILLPVPGERARTGRASFPPPKQAGGGPSTAIKALEKGFIPTWLLGWLEEPFPTRAVPLEQPEP